MADKVINLRIDVTKINKEWLFKGEKGTYLDLALFYNEEKDSYDNNGMIVQSVPKSIRDKDKTVKGAILGNCKEFAAGAGNKEASPGTELPMQGATTEVADDLPF